MSLQDTVHEIVKEKGPVLPAEIVSEVTRRTGQQRDMFFIGAILSELMSGGSVKMTTAKIGGSRLYYVSGQEDRLTKLYDYLNEKEKKAYKLLEEKKVLRGNEQEPVVRVALSQLKDFSKPIEVKLKDTETFWRWYLFPVEDAKKMIKDMVSNELQNLKGDSKEAPQIDAPAPQGERPSPQPKEQKQQEPERKKDDKPNKNEEQSFITQVKESKDKQSRLDETDNHDDEFLEKTRNFLKDKGIRIISSAPLKKGSECELEIETETPVGKMRLYAFAKSKKKLNENDLGFAYIRAKNRNLGLCFITPGELTKKAKEMLGDELRSISFLEMR